MAFTIKLYFDSEPSLALCRTSVDNHTNQKIHSVRGRDAGIFTFAETFVWSSGVKNLCYFLIFSKYQYEILGSRLVLCGGRNSLAAKLSYTVQKEPVWSSQMFGSDIQGFSQLRKLVRINNPNFRLGSKVFVSLNYKRLNPDDIKIYLDGKTVNPFALRKLMEAIQQRKKTRQELLLESFHEFSEHLKFCH